MCFFDKIMAIGTLALCYNNVQVFRGVVKLRRGKMFILSLVCTPSNTISPFRSQALSFYQQQSWERVTSIFFISFYCSGLTAKVIDRTKTMADVYGAFHDFSCMLKTKVWLDPGQVRQIRRQTWKEAITSSFVIWLFTRLCLERVLYVHRLTRTIRMPVWR